MDSPLISFWIFQDWKTKIQPKIVRLKFPIFSNYQYFIFLCFSGVSCLSLGASSAESSFRAQLLFAKQYEQLVVRAKSAVQRENASSRKPSNGWKKNWSTVRYEIRYEWNNNNSRWRRLLRRQNLPKLLPYSTSSCLYAADIQQLFLLLFDSWIYL